VVTWWQICRLLKKMHTPISKTKKNNSKHLGPFIETTFIRISRKRRSLNRVLTGQPGFFWVLYCKPCFDGAQHRPNKQLAFTLHDREALIWQGNNSSFGSKKDHHIRFYQPSSGLLFSGRSKRLPCRWGIAAGYFLFCFNPFCYTHYSRAPTSVIRELKQLRRQREGKRQFKMTTPSLKLVRDYYDS